MAFSYSFHLSAKSHCVSTIGKIGQCSRHNLREYKSENYDRSQIEILVGSEAGILSDVKKIYRDEFDEALKKYNAGKRADRQIDDYLDHVSNSRSDVAAEIIIQIGDKDFWADKTMEQKKQMSYIFTDQLRSLQKLCPEFKIASAVVHYDESSPHMHLVGVPIAEGYKKGMEKQVAKTKVFTADRLSYLQDKMRLNAEKGISLNPDLFAEKKLKAKEKGRNKDIPKHMLDDYYDIQNKVEILKSERDTLSDEIKEATETFKEVLDTNINIRDVEAVETQIKGFGSNKRVVLAQEDWERVKGAAKHQYALSNANYELEQEIKDLKNKNWRLDSRVRELADDKISLEEETKKLQKDVRTFNQFLQENALVERFRQWLADLQHRLHIDRDRSR